MSDTGSMTVQNLTLMNGKFHLESLCDMNVRIENSEVKYYGQSWWPVNSTCNSHASLQTINSTIVKLISSNMTEVVLLKSTVEFVFVEYIDSLDVDNSGLVGGHVKNVNILKIQNCYGIVEVLFEDVHQYIDVRNSHLVLDSKVSAQVCCS